MFVERTVNKTGTKVSKFLTQKLVFEKSSLKNGVGLWRDEETLVEGWNKNSKLINEFL